MTKTAQFLQYTGIIRKEIHTNLIIYIITHTFNKQTHLLTQFKQKAEKIRKPACASRLIGRPQVSSVVKIALSFSKK